MNPHLPSGSIGSNPSEIRPDEVGTIEPPSHLTRKREAGHSPESPGDSLATGSPESVRTITSDDAAKIPLEENASHEPRFSRLTASQHCSDSRASDRASEWGDSDSQRSEVVSSGGAPSSSAAGEESTGSDSLNGRDVSGVNILHEKKGIFASGVIVNWHITVKLNVGRVVYEDAKTSLVPREIFCSDEWFVVNVVFSKGEITTATKPITKQVDQEMSDVGKIAKFLLDEQILTHAIPPESGDWKLKDRLTQNDSTDRALYLEALGECVRDCREQLRLKGKEIEEAERKVTTDT